MWGALVTPPPSYYAERSPPGLERVVVR